MREVIGNTAVNWEGFENDEEVVIAKNRDSSEHEKQTSHVSNVPTDNTSGTPEPEKESRDLDNGNIVREIKPEKEKNIDSLEHEKVKSHVSNFPTDNTLWVKKSDNQILLIAKSTSTASYFSKQRQ